DSTALLATLGDDRMDSVRRAHVKDVTDAVEGGGGRVVKTLGDGVMSSFESALGALRAAAAIQAAVERLDGERGGIGLAARIGVAAGEPIPDGEDLHGMSVVIASRLSSAAGTGEVLVQDLVHGLVASRDGVALEEGRDYDLKGVPAPVRASRLRWRELKPSYDGKAVASAEADGSDGPGREAGDSPAHVRLPPTLAAYAEEPLIGRDREIEMLRESTAPRPGRRAALILGEPGIGKTRHAAATASEAHAGGATVALARCPPETVVPFEPWVRAIGELALAGDEEWRRTLTAAAGPELSALVPELDLGADSSEQANAGRIVAAEGARYRLLRGIGAALGCAAREGPLYLVLDDAQWCDPASAQALRHLLESPPTAELSLVVTAREGELGRRHPVAKALSDLRRTGDLAELSLIGLDAAGTAALVEAKLGRAIAPALARRLSERTSGNPFFASELARDLDGRGALRDDEALAAAPVPDAVTGLVEERLTGLDPATERLLTAAAAIGPSAPIALAAKAAELDSKAAEHAARDALSERLAEEVATAEPTIAFTHALVREALIAEMNDAGRARLHLAIARALEETPDPEPAELARHYGLAVELAGTEPAMAAHRAAAAKAAAGHDHEAAAANLRQLLSLLPADDLAARAPILLELGEQDFLSADLIRARDSFRAAVETARTTADNVTLAHAALGFAGGDIGFGWEVGTDDPTTVALLREGLEALGDAEPRLALRMIFRLAYLLTFTKEDEALAALARRAENLENKIGDAEAHVLSRFTQLAVGFARRPDPLDLEGLVEDIDSMPELLAPAEECGREDLLFRVVQWSAVVNYSMGRIPACERAVERGAEIADRLGSPRFSWEVDLNRSMRLVDRGRRADGEALSRRAGEVVRRLRPDIQLFAELGVTTSNGWIYGGETAMPRRVFEALDAQLPRGAIVAWGVALKAIDGDPEAARRQLRSLLEGDLDGLRHPDGHLPAAVCYLAYAAVWIGDLKAAERLRPLLEPMRSRLIVAAPLLCYGHQPEWHLGRLDLLAGRVDVATSELHDAVAQADELELVWASALVRVDLARALYRGGETERALSVLSEAETIAARYEVGWAVKCAADARAEIEGREPPSRQPRAERTKRIRALATRGGRRALASMVRDLDDGEIERRFVDPRRQRALIRAMARGFQPAEAAGFDGTIVYELQPFAIEAPMEAPWRWAVEVDADGGRARLLEPAPLDPAVTIHFGLADWVRVMAGVDDPLSVMVAGRGSVEGDVTVAARLETMFGVR
ncbi:MAG TPA: AAA family ATPase, partial [Solirubrobacterales bacterium]|nr:AAA family ATPase [Solirubrobacterales bacterium]